MASALAIVLVLTSCTGKRATAPKSGAGVSEDRPIRVRRDRYPMSFRDGNPAEAPGALLIFPAGDPGIVYDDDRAVVINRATGEFMKFNLADREDGSFDAVVMNNEKSPIIVHGYFGTGARPDYGETVAYNLTSIIVLTDEGSKPFEYPVERIAELLNKIPDPYGGLKHTGHVVVIDNHLKRGVL